MLGKKSKVLRFGVFACIALMLISTLTVLADAEDVTQGELGEINGVDVNLSTDNAPKVILSEEGIELYSISYDKLIIGDSEVPLDGDWQITYEKVTDTRFPHMRIKMDRMIDHEAITGHLYFTINVLSLSKNTEVSFSFTLDDISYLASERLLIIQDIDTNGQIVRKPGEKEPGKGLIEYYEFSFDDGHKGFYSWSIESSVGGEKKDSIFMPLQDGATFALGASYEVGAEEVSMSPVDLDNTRMSAMVPVPETYDRVPSFIIGALVTSGLIVGVVFEKRREFYEKKESASFLRLEDSPYYKGKE
ncbi:MAG: hypothetical protein ACQESD_02065 [Thermoplasmatota archaeon]